MAEHLHGNNKSIGESDDTHTQQSAAAQTLLRLSQDRNSSTKPSGTKLEYWERISHFQVLLRAILSEAHDCLFYIAIIEKYDTYNPCLTEYSNWLDHVVLAKIEGKMAQLRHDGRVATEKAIDHYLKVQGILRDFEEGRHLQSRAREIEDRLNYAMRTVERENRNTDHDWDKEDDRNVTAEEDREGEQDRDSEESLDLLEPPK
ncbi:MAG: hypothetical protein M1831_000985 [Alyxoria varia]|nr:MAG: hypothetical protein M1831_000985 [Alyxoria varia]